MSETVTNEYPVNGAERRQGANVFGLHLLADGLGAARESTVIEAEPYEDDDVLDFSLAEE